jgi:hypothetical protein
MKNVAPKAENLKCASLGRRCPRQRRLLGRGAFLIILTVTFAVTAQAQTMDPQLEQHVFDLGLLRTGKPLNRRTAKTATKARDPKELLHEIQEDFTQLQIVNNDLADAVGKVGKLDIDFVSKSAAEIERRSVRLWENLTQSKHETKAQAGTETPMDSARFRKALDDLDNLIIDFSHNRVFKEASPDDTALAAKALRDLDEIISLSRRVRDNAAKLNP